MDLFQNKSQPRISFIKDTENLSRAVHEILLDEVAVRLYLVEDMSAPVVELLGSAYGCHPHLFENHLHTVHFRCRDKIDAIGRPSERDTIIMNYTGRPESASDIGREDFFSLPFRRYFWFEDEDAYNEWPKERTVPRCCTEIGYYVEERVSGAMYKMAEGKHRVCKFL